MKKQQAKRKVATEVLKARGHLRGPLNDLFDETDTMEQTSSTRQIHKQMVKETVDIIAQRGRPTKRPLEAIKVSSPRATSTATASPSKALSRRKTQPQLEESCSSEQSDTEDVQQPKQAKESFIMKLFERSVDLSKFNENTPLYPICRAWFKNQPRNTELPDYKSTTTAITLQREIDGAALYERVLRNEITEIYEMPRPLPTKLTKIPPVYKPAGGYDLAAIDAALQIGATGTWADAAELLENHKLRWRLVRKEWIKHTTQYRQERFKYSYLIIQHLYGNAHQQHQ